MAVLKILWLCTMVLVAMGRLPGLGPVPEPDPTGPRVMLRVLVVADGSPWVDAVRRQLRSEGVATEVIDLNDEGRQRITDDMLFETLSDGTVTGHYQGVVVPGNVQALAPEEQDALASYERAFSVRQVDAFVYPTKDVGMSPPSYAGTLDGAEVTATDAATGDAFRYLRGSFAFPSGPSGGGSYGYLSEPLPPSATAAFTPLFVATVPDSGTTGVLAGVYTEAGRERLVLSFGFSDDQLQFRYLAHGIVSWVTRGVHLGQWRSYLSVHIDDVFNANARWSTVGNCTPRYSACPPGTPDTEPIRMTADDVEYASEWQKRQAFTLDLAFNGGAEERFQVNGDDPMFDAFTSRAAEFRWVNHTYTHRFLGCVQDFTVDPWRCRTDADGEIVWVDPATINDEISANLSWAKEHGFPIDRRELLTGEHSGLRILPQQPVDNPNLVDAVDARKVSYVAMDASREPEARAVGAAIGVPRHPINVFYNVATEAEEVDQYNWIYTSAADGGSGMCEENAPPRCLDPLDPGTGWRSTLVPALVGLTLRDVLHNDPRVFYMHQSNLAGDRLAYPVLDGVLSTYRSVFAANAPVVNARFSAVGEELWRQQLWSAALDAATVSAYVQGNTVTVSGPEGTQVPVTAPDRTRIGTKRFGGPYGGERSGDIGLGSTPITLVLPVSPYVGAPQSSTDSATGTPGALSAHAAGRTAPSGPVLATSQFPAVTRRDETRRQ